MNKILLDALESCLQRVEQGEPLDSVLARYPGMQTQLRPLLEAAICARSARVESLPMAALARQRSRGLALAADLRQGKTRQPFRRYSWRPLMTVLSVIAILVMSSNGLLIASAHSIPGDTLYPLKRSVESTQLQLVSDPIEKDALEHTFDQRRVEETRSLIADERVEEVEFNGLVSSQSENIWEVSGIKVVITSHTQVDGGIQVGDRVDVDGSTNSSGGKDATHISLVNSPDEDTKPPQMTPPPTSTGNPSGESSLQETPTESALAPADSGAGSNQSSESNDQSTTSSHEEHTSGEHSSDGSNHNSHPDSGGGRD
jgi:hypothetical protein